MLKAQIRQQYALLSRSLDLRVSCEGFPALYELVLMLVDLANGHRTLWKRIKTDAQEGSLMVTTPDLKYYAYRSPLYSSDLYIVDNLR